MSEKKEPKKKIGRPKKPTGVVAQDGSYLHSKPNLPTKSSINYDLVQRTSLVATAKDLDNPPSAPGPDFLRDMFNPAVSKSPNKMHPRFKNAEELAYLVGEYFASKTQAVLDEEGFFIGYKWVQKITVSGLANFLHIQRNALYTYSKNEEYGHIIGQAMQIIEEYNEQALSENKNPAGTIFLLKNRFGWQDNTQVQMTYIDPIESVGNISDLRNIMLEKFGVIDITPEDEE